MSELFLIIPKPEKLDINHPNDIIGERPAHLLQAVPHQECPRLLDGLEPWAWYQGMEGEDAKLFFVQKNKRDNSYLEWIDEFERLFMYNGKLDEGKTWPFYEFNRFWMSGATFGPLVSKKLVRDFDNFDAMAWAKGEAFHSQYRYTREFFASVDDSGIASYLGHVRVPAELVDRYAPMPERQPEPTVGPATPEPSCPYEI